MRGGRLLAACCATLLVAGCGLSTCRSAAPPHAKARPHPTPRANGAWFELNGTLVQGAVNVTARSRLRVLFGAQAPPATVSVSFDGQALPADALAWSADLVSVEVPLAGITPYRPVRIALAVPPPFVAPDPIQATMIATVPASGATGVGPAFRPVTPIEIVVENSPPARPQSGLQGADMVYEYLSEYSITRMTAIYFAGIPGEIGPVRSCRMVNPYLGYAFGGVTMCSGVSDGTGGWIVGSTPGSQRVPAVMEGTDRGADFYRAGSRAAPHNLYTSGDLAARLRVWYPQPAGAYAVDPPHGDVAAGQPADPPAAPLHGATYAYDGGAREYLRSDHGAPFVDQVTGQQVHVKNVVLLHVPFHDAGWVEDENGGAHSVWYDMLGSGPAEVYSDGQVVHATWHMGTAGQMYFDNHAPVWFTDEAGRPLLLNTGLTWIHVLGNGQERCPVSPADCG